MIAPELVPDWLATVHRYAIDVTTPLVHIASVRAIGCANPTVYNSVRAVVAAMQI